MGNYAVWLDLNYQIKDRHKLKLCWDRYHFLLASDGTHNRNLNHPGQFVVTITTSWLKAFEQKGQDTVEGVETTLVDNMTMSALDRSKLWG